MKIVMHEPLTEFAGPSPFVVAFDTFDDNRGYFTETYRQSDFLDTLLFGKSFVQDNESFSYKGVLRGLHFQYDQPMGKLVRAVTGRILDLMVDIRKNSPSYGCLSGYILTPKRKEWLYVPPGFAHGIVAIDDCLFHYKCTEQYNGDGENGIHWNQEVFTNMMPLAMQGIFNGQIQNGLIISEKDNVAMKLSEWEKCPESDLFTWSEPHG